MTCFRYLYFKRGEHKIKNIFKPSATLPKDLLSETTSYVQAYQQKIHSQLHFCKWVFEPFISTDDLQTLRDISNGIIKQRQNCFHAPGFQTKGEI